MSLSAKSFQRATYGLRPSSIWPPCELRVETRIVALPRAKRRGANGASGDAWPTDGAECLRACPSRAPPGSIERRAEPLLVLGELGDLRLRLVKFTGQSPVLFKKRVGLP